MNTSLNVYEYFLKCFLFLFKVCEDSDSSDDEDKPKKSQDMEGRLSNSTNLIKFRIDTFTRYNS